MKLIAVVLAFAAVFSLIVSAQPECDYKSEVIANSTEFQRDSFNWRMKATKLEGSPTNITGTAEILDSEGKTVKTYKPWTNEPISKQKTSSQYSPNLKVGEYKIISRINVECNDMKQDNNVDFKIIRINPEAQNEITIGKNQPEFSRALENATDNIKIKNETNFNSSSAINDKGTAKQNTEKKSRNEDGDNTIELKNDEIKNYNEIQLTANAIKNNDAVYESSSEKAKNLILFSLLALSILLNIVLVWKR